MPDPFTLASDDDYLRWRDWKLENKPGTAGDVTVEIRDSAQLTGAERDALLSRLICTNAAIYKLDRHSGDPEDIVRSLAGALGLKTLDDHLCAEEDRITPLFDDKNGTRKRYIPYTDKPINWHTDGYYNDEARRVRAFMLHCVTPAETGGENALMDPELVYIRLRDENPDLIEALYRADAMNIPPNEEAGKEIRGACSGPVFWVDESDGSLGMRYTARTRSIAWKDDAATQEAVEALRTAMADDSRDILTCRLGPGEGTITNNILHTRTRFSDAEGNGPARLVYRARFHDRIAGTGLRETAALWSRNTKHTEGQPA